MNASTRSKPGISIIELLAVIIIMGILAAVALPRFSNSLNEFRASAAAKRIIADLTLAQSTAYSTSSPKTVTFNVTSSQYDVAGVRSLDRASGVYRVSLVGSPYLSTLLSVWGLSGSQSITFDGYGRPNKGGQIVLASGGIRKTIVVEPILGTMVIQ